MNVDNSSFGTTLIIKKIGKFEDLLTSGQAILVDKAGNPLKKVEFMGEYDSEDKVALVDNDMARSMAYERDDQHPSDVHRDMRKVMAFQTLCSKFPIIQDRLLDLETLSSCLNITDVED
nr:hypothetical protein [Tanacetum cinerariifolium]